MKIESMRLRKFKRFEDLTIEGLPPTAGLVVVTGANGTGKSGILEALNHYRRHRKWGYNNDNEYFLKKSEHADPTINYSNQVQVTFHGGEQTPEQSAQGIWVRPAYRHQAEFNVTGFQRQPAPADDPGQDRLILPDALVASNYSRLLSDSISTFFDEANREVPAGLLVQRVVGVLQESLAHVFGDLQVDNLTDPLNEGTFYFTKGESRHFSFKNLSAGERAAFDILLDVVVRRQLFGDVIYGIDEPELHLGSRVQARLLDRLLQLMPADTSQLWVATHSPGIMKRALELHKQDASAVVFLDTHDHNFDQPTVMRPIQPSRSFWRRSMEVALDDIATLVAPEHVVLCEGQNLSQGFDAQCYGSIFSSQAPGVEFLSVGNAFEVNDDKRGVAAAIQVLAPGTKITKLIDRDDLSDQQVSELASEGTKVLSKRNLEGYLLDDEVLNLLCQSHDKASKASVLLEEKERHLDEAAGRGRPRNDLKAIAKNMKVIACRELQLSGRGSTFEEFARLELVPHIAPGTDVYAVLHADIFD